VTNLNWLKTITEIAIIMKLNRLYTYTGIFFLAFLGCKSNKDAVYSGGLSERTLDTLTVTAPADIIYEVPVYRAAADRSIDLVHTQLKVEFGWEEQAVYGNAALIMTPKFYPLDTVELDAVGFEIHKITGNNVIDEYPFQYDGKKLRIPLDKEYKRGERITLVISYTAYPERNDISGSDAITSDKGLFFINPTKEDPDKPRQVWTQGETENNSRWFPTIDKPNERCTQDIRIVVDSTMTTLSNGVMIYSKNQGDGTKVERWILDKPHAPYLFMLAVGDFAKVTDSLDVTPERRLGLDYYVEPEYEEDARAIFNHTPEMVSYFGEILQYPYPWPKYGQVVVRDFVSGAMENTTASVFGEFVQKTERELIDNENDLIVAHELFHHWFGDLVTCESWANLTLNEGFANYSEYLWLEHKYGKDKAEAHRYNERNAYFGSAAQQGVHPLIHYSYEDKEDMFDAHSYNKGGLVLHMLRDMLGDEAFFASLNQFLVDNEFTAVEVDELRMAFEDVTGLDLNWFFDQWYLSKGHPILEVSYGQNLEAGLFSVIVSQTQDLEELLPVFRLPLDIAVYDENGKKHIYPVEMTKRDQLFLLDVDYPVSYAVVDDGNVVLAEIRETKSTDKYVAQAKFEENYIDRMEALKRIKGTPEFKALVPSLMKESYWQYRKMAVANLDITDPEQLKLLLSAVKKDAHSAVRSAALKQLSDGGYTGILDIAKQALNEDQAFNVIGNALKVIYKQDAEKGLQAAKTLDEEEKGALRNTLADIYSATGDAQYLSFFAEHLKDIPFYEMFNFYDQYTRLLKEQEAPAILEGTEKLAVISNSDASIYRKFSTTSAIHKLKQHLAKMAEQTEVGPKKMQLDEAVMTLTATLEEIIASERNENLLNRYQAFK
jgi:aminopeptidase N